MARAKFQVLVIPFSLKGNTARYCVFYRTDMHIWQFIAGGGEGVKHRFNPLKEKPLKKRVLHLKISTIL